MPGFLLHYQQFNCTVSSMILKNKNNAITVLRAVKYFY